MPKNKWFYYLHEEGNVIMSIMRANSDAFEWRFGEFGFEPCSYAKHLEARKTIREREVAENKINYVAKIKVQVPEGE